MIAGYPWAEKCETWTWKLQKWIQYSKQWLHATYHKLSQWVDFWSFVYSTKIFSRANISSTLSILMIQIEHNSRYLWSVTLSCALSVFLFIGLQGVSAAWEQSSVSAWDIAILQQHFSDEAIFVNGALLWSKQARTSSAHKPSRAVAWVVQSKPLSTPEEFTISPTVEWKGLLAQLRSFNDKWHRDNKRREIVLQSRRWLRKLPQHKDNSLLALIHWLLLKEEQSPELTT